MSGPRFDDSSEVCLCFHVPLGKLRRFLQRRQPRLASQLSECHGAGSGCGWCIPFLEKMHEQHRAGLPLDLGISPEEYKARRAAYRRDKKPELPPTKPIEVDVDALLDEIPDDLKLDPGDNR